MLSCTSWYCSICLAGALVISMGVGHVRMCDLGLLEAAAKSHNQCCMRPLCSCDDRASRHRLGSSSFCNSSLYTAEAGLLICRQSCRGLTRMLLRSCR